MKKLSFIILIFSFCTVTSLHSQTAKLEWAKQMSGKSYDACKAIVLDGQANIYATGYFSDIVDFDPGAGVFNLTSFGAEDIYISKADPDGNLIWVKQIGGFRYQAGYAITLDAANNIYVTGIFFGTVDFDPGPGISNLTSAGNEDVFICKLNNNGNFLWAKKIGGVSNDFCNAIVLDNTGNIFCNGYFDGTADFDPGNGIFNMTALGATDIYVCKFTNDGTFLWAKQMGGTSSEAAYSIALDDQNNVYSTGFFWGTADFDPGPAVFNLQSSGFGDGYILKLSSNGNLIKAGKLGGTNQVRSESLKLDKAGYIYLTGYFDGVTDFDMGTGIVSLNSSIGDEDIFIAKYNLNLDFVWVKQIIGVSFQKAFSIDVDEKGDVYTTGHYNGSADFDPGPGTYQLTASGDPNIFVLKLNSSGNFIWVAQGEGPFYGSGYSLKVDKTNNIYVGGTFEGAKDFNPGPETYTLTSAGESEIFIQKLKQCTNVPLTDIRNINTCSSYYLNNKRYDTTGTYFQLILNTSGCDSIIIRLNLTIIRIINELADSICEGQYHYAGGALQYKPGKYYDTLQNVFGCDSVVITNLAVNPNPQPNLGINRNLCQGQTITLNPGDFTSYLWQNLSTQPVFIASQKGNYSVTVKNQFNCSATANITIKDVVALPNNFLPANQELCTGNVLKINIKGYKNYLWSTGATEENITIRAAGVYYAEVTNLDDCIGSDTIIIKETKCIPVSVPNGFTPNGDGKNDFFRPFINTEINDYKLKIFNRLGQTVFATQNYIEYWDGNFKNQPQTPGTYVYQINFRNIDGKLFTYTGNIMLIR
jgi:gliding motility-associated-like protein